MPDYTSRDAQAAAFFKGQLCPKKDQPLRGARKAWAAFKKTLRKLGRKLGRYRSDPALMDAQTRPLPIPLEVYSRDDNPSVIARQLLQEN